MENKITIQITEQGYQVKVHNKNGVFTETMNKKDFGQFFGHKDIDRSVVPDEVCDWLDQLNLADASNRLSDNFFEEKEEYNLRAHKPPVGYTPK